MKVKEILDKHSIQYSNYRPNCNGGTECPICTSVVQEYSNKPAIICGRKCVVTFPEGSMKILRSYCTVCGSLFYVVLGNDPEEKYITVRDSFSKFDVLECNW